MDILTGWPKTSDRETTVQLCKTVYESPEFIPIRDKYVKIALQNHNSKLDFLFSDGCHTFKIFHKGKPKEVRHLDFKEFFRLINEMCNLDLPTIELPIK